MAGGAKKIGAHKVYYASRKASNITERNKQKKQDRIAKTLAKCKAKREAKEAKSNGKTEKTSKVKTQENNMQQIITNVVIVTNSIPVESIIPTGGVVLIVLVIGFFALLITSILKSK